MEKKQNLIGSRRKTRIYEIVFLIILPVLVHYLIPVRVIIPPPWSYLGIILMITGFGYMILAAREFRNNETGFQLKNGGTKLVTSGPFQLSRNPMYLGMVAWMFGLAISLGSLTTFIFPVTLFLLAHLLLIPIEEKKMEQLFGMEYLNYKNQVRRWFLF